MIKKLLLMIVSLIATTCAWSTDYTHFKEKPLTIIIPYGPGGNSDVVGRLLASRITYRTGINTVVLNRPGAAGTIGTSQLANALPDGHTVMFSNTLPLLNHLTSVPGAPDISKVEFISPIMESPQVIVVSTEKYPDIKTYRDLINKINSKSNYSSAFSMMKVWVDVVVEHEKIQTPQQILYKSQSEVLTAVLRGEVLFTFAGISDANKLIESGKLRVLAAATNKRIPLIPETPTLRELGVKNSSFSGYFGVWVPSEMNRSTKEKLNQLFQDALWDGDTIAFMHSKGLIPIGGDLTATEKFRTFITADHVNMINKELFRQ